MIESFPLCWPVGWKRTAYRRGSAFKIAGFGKARDLLLAEIRRMGGAQMILSTNIPLRNDGLPYANTREPNDPGVAVYFTYKKKQMCFACDRYRTARENAYAIAKTIEALRGIERWGASDMMERAFQGFAALPEKASEPWRDTLGLPHDGNVTGDDVDTAFRRLVQEYHPDKGGDPEKFQAVVQARQMARKELALPEVR